MIISQYCKTTSRATGDRKTAKGPGSHMLVPAIRNGIDRKLYRLARPTHSGVSALAEKPRNIEAEAGGQRPADTEAGSPRSGV